MPCDGKSGVQRLEERRYTGAHALRDHLPSLRRQHAGGPRWATRNAEEPAEQVEQKEECEAEIEVTRRDRNR